jgi:hypothetical protein
MIVGKPILDGDVLALDESGLVQALTERSDKVLGAGRRRGAQETDQRYRRLLLRARGARPKNCVRGSRAAEQRDEIASM